MISACWTTEAKCVKCMQNIRYALHKFMPNTFMHRVQFACNPVFCVFRSLGNSVAASHRMRRMKLSDSLKSASESFCNCSILMFKCLNFILTSWLGGPEAIIQILPLVSIYLHRWKLIIILLISKLNASNFLFI